MTWNLMVCVVVVILTTNRPTYGHVFASAVVQHPLQAGRGSCSPDSFNFAVKPREQVERILKERGFYAKPGSTLAVHNNIVYADEESLERAEEGFHAIETSQSYIRSLRDAGIGLNETLFRAANLTSTDSQSLTTPCPSTKYRSIDGSCNNLHNKKRGTPCSAYNRLMPPLYADRVSNPRIASKDGSRLPSTRLVSTTVLRGKGVARLHVTALFSFFGQFLDHDLSLTPALKTNATGQPYLCCDPIVRNQSLLHPECFSIAIPATDAFYSDFNQTCMEFLRSLPAGTHEGSNTSQTEHIYVREQMNRVTAYLDASQVYASRDNISMSLRLNVTGKLRTVEGTPAGHDFPPNQNTGNCKGDLNKQKFCFLTGDVRSTETPQLATLHILFLREHNRLAGELSALNPSWDDETLYQEARRIVGAKLQHISYNEFLPTVLGNRVMHVSDLQIPKRGFWSKYDPNTDATLLNEFVAAAYRYGHSNIPSMVRLFSGDQNTLNQRLRDHFMRPYESKLFNEYVGGLVNQVSLVTDNQVSKELTEHLFQQDKSFGLDLPAITMQRGRDHAIATYTQARTFCGLPNVTSFDHLKLYMYTGAPAKLASVYNHVEDVDLWIGGVSETPLPGAVVGPTFACIIGEQFRRTRKGDRFWYERGGADTSFTQAQLEEIKLTSMARIICDNSDILEVQPKAFWNVSNGNAIVSCDSHRILKSSVKPWLI